MSCSVVFELPIEHGYFCEIALKYMDCNQGEQGNPGSFNTVIKETLLSFLDSKNKIVQLLSIVTRIVAFEC